MKSKKSTSFNIEEFNKENIFEELRKELFTEEFTLKNLGDNNITARHLQYWSENGLLPDKKRKTDENHAFSFVDLIWIKIVYELRVLNFPLAKIKIVKDTLLQKKSFPEFFDLKNDEAIVDFYYQAWKIDSKNRDRFVKLFSSKDNLNSIKSTFLSVLSFFILIFITERANSKIIIFNEGTTIPFVEKYKHNYGVLPDLMEKETYISISLFKLMSNFIKDEKNYSFISKALILNDNELKILMLLRSGNFDKMTIHFKKGEPVFVEKKEHIKVYKESRLSEILLNRGYEKIEIITQDGDISYAPKTTKIFL